MRNRPCMTFFVPEHFKTRETCDRIMRTMPGAFHHIPNRFKTQEMCLKAAEADSLNLGNVPDHFKTQMRDATVRDDPSSLIYIPNWFVRQPQVNMWYRFKT